MTKELKKSQNASNGITRNIFDFLEVFVYAFAVVLIILTFLVRHSPVSGTSMVNTLQNGDLLLIDIAGYNEIENGDIVVFQTPGLGYDEPLVKRVIATEGQTLSIDIDNWKVYVDGEEVTESYIDVIDGIPMTTQQKYQDSYEWPITIPEGKVFVMGDNRTNSIDSRFDDLVGLVDERTIIGKVVLRLFPFDQFGSVYN